MRSKSESARRVVALGLAVWFGALSVSIELLHRHPMACAGAARHGYARDAGHLSAATPGFPLSAVRDAPRSGSQEDYTYCPACLFLKSCNQQAVTWVACIPVVAPDAYPHPYDAGFTAFPVILSRFPRAPPSPLT